MFSWHPPTVLFLRAVRLSASRLGIPLLVLAVTGCSTLNAPSTGTTGPAGSATAATPSGVPATRSATPSTPSQAVPAQPSLPPGVTQIDTPGAPLAVALAFDSVWVSSHRGRTLYRIDPSTSEIVARIDMGSEMCGDIGVGAGDLWVFTCPALRTLRVDPETNQIDGTVPATGGAMPAFGAGSVWLPDGFGPTATVVRADPGTGSIEAKIPAGESPAFIVHAFDDVWVSNFDDATVSRIDPRSNRVVATIPVGPPGGRGSGYMAATDTALWVTNEFDRRVYRIDPDSNTSEAVDVGARGLTEFFDRFIATGAGSLWMRTEDRTVAQLDASTGAVTRLFAAGSGGGDVGASEDSLWIANFGDDTVWRYDLP